MQTSREFVRSLPGDPSALSARRGLLKRFHIDGPLLVLLLILAAYGLTVLYSASGSSLHAVKRQATFFLIAFTGMLIVAQFDVKTFRRFSPAAYGVGLILLVLVFFFGVGAKGAQRWLNVFGLLQFQPSELMKLAVPMAAAWYLSDNALPPSVGSVAVSLLIVLLPSALIVTQPDLGTSLLIASSGLFVLWLAGLQWSYIILALGTLAASAWPAWHFFLHDYQRQRILTLFDPESDKLGAGWNIIQSKTAIGSGGWSGKGWLNGTQSHLDFLPESHTDFIIAVLAEEYGLRGVLFLLLLYVLIILRGAYIGLRATNTFARLVAGSITLTFFIYIFVNMGMVSGILPVVGVPLPLVSYGGTALVTMMAGFGVLMAISSQESVV